LVGLRIWHRLEQRGVDHAENGRGRADAQAERQHGYRREAWDFQQRPSAVAQIPPQVSNHVSSPFSTRPYVGQTGSWRFAQAPTFGHFWECLGKLSLIVSSNEKPVRPKHPEHPRDPELVKELELDQLPPLSMANVRELLRAVIPLLQLTVERATELVVEHLVNRASRSLSQISFEKVGLQAYFTLSEM
jgi:hypothetical protein